jgi:hypothetical protein
VTPAATAAPTIQPSSRANSAVTPPSTPVIPPAMNMGNAQQPAHATIIATAPSAFRFLGCMRL